jgi:hypothetical protein
MIVSVRDEGTTWQYPLDVSADNLLIAAMLLGSVSGILGRLDRDGYLGAVASVVLAVGGAALFAVVVAEGVGIAQLLRMYLRGFRACPPDVKSRVEGQMHECGVRRALVLWEPTNFAVDARSFGSFFIKGVAVTGGAVALADIEPDAFRGLVTHEAAHLTNYDIFFLALLVGDLGLAAMMADRAGPFVDDEVACRILLEFLTKPLFLLVMVYRRELLADAFALSHVANRDVYVRMLAAGAMRDRFLHPSRHKRMRACRIDNPVLRRRAWILLLCAWMIGSIAYGLFSQWTIYVSNLYERNQLIAFLWYVGAFVAGAYFPYKAFVAELGKGPERKIAFTAT